MRFQSQYCGIICAILGALAIITIAIYGSMHLLIIWFYCPIIDGPIKHEELGSEYTESSYYYKNIDFKIIAEQCMDKQFNGKSTVKSSLEYFADYNVAGVNVFISVYNYGVIDQETYDNWKQCSDIVDRARLKVGDSFVSVHCRSSNTLRMRMQKMLRSIYGASL